VAGKKAKKKKASVVKRGKRVSGAQRMELKAFLDNVHAHALTKEDAGATQGACLVTDPQTGQSTCILTDQTTCKSLGGKFIGGPCGS
jgi:hypothetical protein